MRIPFNQSFNFELDYEEFIKQHEQGGVRPGYNVERTTCLIGDMIEQGDGYLHIDRGQNETPLYELSDSHLINIIAFHARNIAEGMRANSQITGTRSMLSAVMSGKAQVEQQVENLKDYITGGYVILGRYVVEAMRRGSLIKDAVEACMPYTNALNELDNVDAKGNVIAQIKGGE